MAGHAIAARGKSAVAVLWRLEDAKGHEIGERGVGIEGTAEDWQIGRAAR